MAAQTENLQERRQLVDWSAAYWAGLVAGLAFLSMYLLVAPLVMGSTLTTFLTYVASLLWGVDVVSQDNLDPASTILAIVLHLIFSFVFALLIVIVIHRWGMVVGIALGAVLGLVVYAITILPMSYLFPWFVDLNNWFLVLTHAVFGAVAGGVYEFLEVEEYEVID